ncbi:serine protease [Micromonospora sp. NPDC049171]|uniref:S1 family peptidase n=1 Tax=Micromonospora sp. NPDC049171 TaxID=3155770 RepID=UPI00340F926C
MVNSRGNEPWLVRVRSTDGEVLGAGLALGDRRILTCAHVVSAGGDTESSGTEPSWEVLVDLLGQPGSKTVSARVVPGCWWPPTTDQRDDIALLELAEPMSQGPFAPLRRTVTVDRTVMMYGFPAGVEHGLYVQAQLMGRSGAGWERFQMNSGPTQPRVRPGFSGAAVVDVESGDVVGMVVSTYLDGDRSQHAIGGADQGGVSWMIPVETILNRLPSISGQVPGKPAVDPSFRSAGDTSANREATERITDFFGRGSPGNVLVLVIGHRDSDIAAAVRRAAVLSSRELRPRTDPDQDPTAPPIGSIDLAVDATGRSAREVSQRLADWAGATSTAPDGYRSAETTPHSMIINNIDGAADPEALLSEVILPLVDQAPSQDLRIMLTFSGESIALRTTLLARRVASLQAAEEAVRRAYRAAAALVADVPRLQPLATDLRIQLTKLRAAGGDTVAARLASTERAADRALARVESVRRKIAAREGLWSELDGRVGAYRARAVQHGFAEDPALGTSYRRAHDLLLAVPCELVAAEAAVREYAEMVSRRVGGQRGGDAS